MPGTFLEHRPQAQSAVSRPARGVDFLTQVLADTVRLREMYMTHRPEASLPRLRSLFDRHLADQEMLAGHIGGQIQALGGTLPGQQYLTRCSLIPGPSQDSADTPLIARFLGAHEIILVVCRAMMQAALVGLQDARDSGVSCVIQINQTQVLSLCLHMSREPDDAEFASRAKGDSLSPESSFP